MEIVVNPSSDWGRHHRVGGDHRSDRNGPTQPQPQPQYYPTSREATPNYSASPARRVVTTIAAPSPRPGIAPQKLTSHPDGDAAVTVAIPSSLATHLQSLFSLPIAETVQVLYSHYHNQHPPSRENSRHGTPERPHPHPTAGGSRNQQHYHHSPEEGNEGLRESPDGHQYLVVTPRSRLRPQSAWMQLDPITGGRSGAHPDHRHAVAYQDPSRHAMPPSAPEPRSDGLYHRVQVAGHLSVLEGDDTGTQGGERSPSYPIYRVTSPRLVHSYSTELDQPYRQATFEQPAMTAHNDGNISGRSALSTVGSLNTIHTIHRKRPRAGLENSGLLPSAAGRSTSYTSDQHRGSRRSQPNEHRAIPTRRQPPLAISYFTVAASNARQPKTMAICKVDTNGRFLAFDFHRAVVLDRIVVTTPGKGQGPATFSVFVSLAGLSDSDRVFAGDGPLRDLEGDQSIALAAPVRHRSLNSLLLEFQQKGAPSLSSTQEQPFCVLDVILHGHYHDE
jgi:hypothetical protein